MLFLLDNANAGADSRAGSGEAQAGRANGRLSRKIRRGSL